MSDLAELDATAQHFFSELNRSTEGKTEVQASMYIVGEAIGLDREASERAAEDLIARGLVEIRTLSGGIGLSDEGVAALSEGHSRGKNAPRLGTDSPLDAERGKLVDDLLTRLKAQLGDSGLRFEILAEVVADIRTIEAQMASPRPKTGIIRESLGSLLETAKDQGQAEWRRFLESFLA